MTNNNETAAFSTRTIAEGLIFSMLWASASTAGKFGLRFAEPLVLFDIRFFVAGALLLVYTHGIQRERLPKTQEWRQIALFSLLNTALYLGLFVVALRFVAAGITSLSIALNPLLISLFSSWFAKRRIRAKEWVTIALGMAGVGIAAYPLLQTSYASVGGLLLLAGSMIAYSLGTVYYSSVKWSLPRLVVNGWQTLIGGVMLLPLAVILHNQNVVTQFNIQFWLSIAWLVLPVSIGAVQLWLHLLKIDAVRASIWLFLCPIFGFIYATLLLGEPFSMYTVAGTAFVMTALLLGQRR